jgi:hypothetical protein
VFIQFIRSVVPGPHGPDQSNLLLTHDTVESPLNSSPQPSSLLERENGRIQSNQRALRQPLALACLRSPQIYCLTPGKIRAVSYGVFPLIMCQAALASLQASALVATIPLTCAVLRS